jgi:hypothetical protein
MSNKSLLVINNQPLSQKDFFSAIDDEIVNLHDTGDINHVMKVLNGLDDVEDITGKAKAKLLWASSEWFTLNKPTEDFTDHVISTTRIKKSMVDRYVPTWKYIEDCIIPKEIQVRPMRELVPIAMTLKQGYEISKEQWRKIGLCSNDRELDEVLRKVKGKQPRKNARIIKLGKDGSLWGWKNNERYFLGYLNVKEAEENEVIAEFIEKIKTSAGVIDE